MALKHAALVAICAERVVRAHNPDPGGSMSDNASPGEQLTALLLDKIESDRFPSVTMMTIVERNLGQEQRAKYLKILLEKISQDRFPSIDMLHRIERLSA
jgi:hypothetical protein